MLVRTTRNCASRLANWWRSFTPPSRLPASRNSPDHCPLLCVCRPTRAARRPLCHWELHPRRPARRPDPHRRRRTVGLRELVSMTIEHARTSAGIKELSFQDISHPRLPICDSAPVSRCRPSSNGCPPTYARTVSPRKTPAPTLGNEPDFCPCLSVVQFFPHGWKKQFNDGWARMGTDSFCRRHNSPGGCVS